MVLNYIIATLIYLAAAWIFNLLVSTLFSIVDTWLKNSNKTDKEFKNIYSLSKISMMLLLIYINLFMVTLLTKYFYYLVKPNKVQIACIIPILLAVSLLNSIKKTSKQITFNEYKQGRFDNDINPLVSYEMQKIRDEFTGYGSFWGLILFLIYYFYPTIFIKCLKFFFLN